MWSIKAVVRNRRVEADMPSDVPDGAEVTIRVSPPEDDAMPPEEIARVLAAMAAVEPFDMTEAERADIDAWRRRQRDYTLATMDADLSAVPRLKVEDWTS